MELAGAALSLLDALYLSIQIPTATVNFIGFGLPRVRSNRLVSPLSLFNILSVNFTGR